MSLQAIRPQKIKQKAAQKQSTEQQQVTYQDSLSVVNLLLQTGLGCVTFLRGIFPERAYKDDKIDNSSIPGLKAENARNSSVRTKTLKRGEVPEADNVLDYLEQGVSDALKKGYLKTFMFGIYLDPEQPHNLVELYTFNFVYRDLSQKNGEGNEETLKVPEMEVRDQLRGMSIASVGARNTQASGSAETQSEEAKKWTVSEVRKQVQNLVKNLLIMTQNLSELPRKRYITFKLYYTDDTPADYEPPHFHSVEHEAARFIIGTRDAENQPETDTIGRVDTGHHCLTLRLVSVANQLPDQDDLRQSQQVGPPPAVEASQRAILWDGEDMTIDEACEISFETPSEKQANAAKRKPLGKLDPVSGEIVEMDVDEEARGEDAEKGSERMLDGLNADFDVDMDLPDTPPRSPRQGQLPAKPVRRGTVQYALSQIVIDPEATQLLSDAEKLKAAAEEQEPDYTQDTFPLPVRQADERMDGPPSARKPFGAESYMFSQETEVIEESRNTERDGSGQSETVPSRLRRQDSTFGYSSLLRPSGEKAKPDRESELQQDPETQTQQDSPILQFTQTEEVETVVTAREERRKKPMRVDSSEDEDIQDDSSRVVLKKQQDQIVTPSSSKHKVIEEKTGTGTPNDPIKLADTPSSSPLSNVAADEDEDDSLPPARPDFSKLGNTPTSAKQGSKKETKEEKKLERKASRHSEEAETISVRHCDCGEEQDDDDMAECIECGTWVHNVCFGYEDRTAIPENFYCYHCIASERRPEDKMTKKELDTFLIIYAALSGLALFRRALWIVYVADPELTECLPMKAFAVRLGADLQTAKGIWERLEKEKFMITSTSLASGGLSTSLFIRSESAARKKGKKEAAAEPPRVNKNKDQLKLKKTRYFTPGEGEEKEILQEHGLMDADHEPAPDSRMASLTVPLASAVSVSPPRKQLADIRHSPRTNSKSPNVPSPGPSTTRENGKRKDTATSDAQSIPPIAIQSGSMGSTIPFGGSSKEGHQRPSGSKATLYVPVFGNKKAKAAAPAAATAMAIDETIPSADPPAPSASGSRFRDPWTEIHLAGQRTANAVGASRKRAADEEQEEGGPSNNVTSNAHSSRARKKASMAGNLLTSEDQFAENEFEESMTYLHITDIHPDPFYKTNSSVGASCHHNRPSDDGARAGALGTALSECDTPLALVDHTFDWLEKEWSKDVDFVIWTGDNARHDIDSTLPRSMKEIYELNRGLTRRFQRMFEHRGIPVVPSLGNNDIYPHNIITAGPNAISTEFAKIWSPFIPAEEYHTVTRGIYFSREVIPDQLVVVSMNTMYFFDNNKVVDGCPPTEPGQPADPGTLQLDWLVVQLGRWRDRGLQVWLTGHVPPTQGNWYEGCLKRYTEIAISFQDTILGQMYGHVNVDTFSYLDYKSLNNKPAKGKQSRSKKDYSIAKFTHDDLYSIYNALPPSRKMKLEDYAIAHTGPSVIPTYLPSVRVWHYNVTDPSDSYVPGSGSAVGKEVGLLERAWAGLTEYWEGLEWEHIFTFDVDILRHRKKKHGRSREKKKKPVPRLPRYFSPDSPSRTNRYLTPLGYTQYHLPIDKYTSPNWTLEYITYPLKRIQHYLPKHMHLNASETRIDAPYKMQDLTIPSWLKLAKGLTQDKHQWQQYVRRMYVSSGAEKR